MRRSGKTTRMVDEAIQHLFNNKNINLHLTILSKSDFVDVDAERHNLAQKYFIDMLIKRLENEHPGAFKIDKNKGSISITTI